MGLKKSILKQSSQIRQAYGRGLDVITRLFLDSVKAVPDVCNVPVQVSRVSLALAQSVSMVPIPADTEDREIPVAGGRHVSVRIIRPKDQLKKSLPVIIYFHGGGWVLGGLETHERYARKLAVETDCAVVFVNYQLSPEVKYPVAIEEAYGVTQSIADHGEILNLDSSRIALAGDSSGGNLAAVTALLAKERGGPHITCQILLYPVTDAHFDTGTYEKYAEGYFLTRESMKWYWDQYLPNKEDRKKPMASPLQATAEQLKGLPPALVITAEFDVLRDEGEAYAKKMSIAGVSVTLHRIIGTIHSFTWMAATEYSRPAKKALNLTTNFLRKHFRTPA